MNLNEYDAEKLGLLYNIIQITKKAKLTKVDLQNYVDIAGNKSLGSLNTTQLKQVIDLMLKELNT